MSATGVDRFKREVKPPDATPSNSTLKIPIYSPFLCPRNSQTDIATNTDDTTMNNGHTNRVSDGLSVRICKRHVTCPFTGIV